MKLETRNINAASIGILQTVLQEARWSLAGMQTDGQLTVKKAVKEGLRKNGYVYRAIDIASSLGSTPPAVVRDSDGEIIPNHPVSQLLSAPNIDTSGTLQRINIIKWLELVGECYLYFPESGSGVWEVNPDRLMPIPSVDIGKSIDGYKVVKENGHGKQEWVRDDTFNSRTVCAIRYTDPANPYRGISPLEAAAQSVDLDTSMQSLNKRITDAGGVSEGIIALGQGTTAEQADHARKSILKRIIGKFAERIAVIAGDPKYLRLGMTQEELGYIQGRTMTREEIFIIFGIPPVLAGVMDKSTYNNYITAQSVVWENKIIPMLTLVGEQLSIFFTQRGMLAVGESVCFDYSNIQALRTGMLDRARSAQIFYSMGIPVDQINKNLGLGFGEYAGWDVSSKQPVAVPASDRAEPKRGLKLRSIAVSNTNKRDDLIEGEAQRLISKALSEGISAIPDDISDGANIAATVTEAMRQSLTNALEFTRDETGLLGMASITIRQEGFDEGEFLNMVATQVDVLRQLSLIDATTTKIIIQQSAYAMENGLTVADFQRNLIDTGVFSPERALRIARTVGGAAYSVGQITGASEAGATTKSWITSGFEVRDIHINRDGETVGINDRFSNQGTGTAPRYPCDPEAGASDIVNCRCSLTFGID